MNIEINWAEIVIGFLLGLLPSFIHMIKNVYKYAFNKSKFLGDYYFYHLSGTQNGLIRAKNVKIVKSFSGFLKVQFPISEDTGLSFEGKVLKSDHSLIYIIAEGQNHREKLFMIINMPVNRNFKLLVGVFSALNIHSVPMCGKMILSKEKMENEQIKKIIIEENIYAKI